jgi:hypothetical protein
MGVLRDCKAGDRAILRGQTTWVRNEVMAGIRSTFGPEAVCDLTPNYAQGAYGMLVHRQHARFWVVACPYCRGGSIQSFTVCRACGGKRKVMAI